MALKWDGKNWWIQFDNYDRWFPITENFACLWLKIHNEDEGVDRDLVDAMVA